MQVNEIWKNSILSHKAEAKLDSNAALVAASFKQAASNATANEAFIKLLAEKVPLTMLSKPVIGDGIQISAFHSLFGSTLLRKQQSILALTGSPSGAMMGLAPNSFPLFSTSAFVPVLDVILNCKKIEDVDNIQPGTSKEKVRNVVILTPAISKVIYNLQDLSSKHVLFSVIKKLRDMEKAQQTQSTQINNWNPDNEAPPETDMDTVAATIREETKLACGDMLLTLWKIAFKGDHVSAVLGLPVHEAEKKRHIHQVSGYHGSIAHNVTLPED